MEEAEVVLASILSTPPRDGPSTSSCRVGSIQDDVSEREKKIISRLWVVSQGKESSLGAEKGGKGRASFDENVGGELNQLPELAKSSSRIDRLLRSLFCFALFVYNC